MWRAGAATRSGLLRRTDWKRMRKPSMQRRYGDGCCHLTGPANSSTGDTARLSGRGCRRASPASPIQIEGGTHFVHASGSYCETSRAYHCCTSVALLLSPRGEALGGHLSPHMCVVGPGRVEAILMLTVEFNQIIDRETRYSLFSPIRR